MVLVDLCCAGVCGDWLDYLGEEAMSEGLFFTGIGIALLFIYGGCLLALFQRKPDRLGRLEAVVKMLAQLELDRTPAADVPPRAANYRWN